MDKETLVTIFTVLGILYLLFLAVLFIVSRLLRKTVIGRFVPDCLTLFRRLLTDDRVAKRYKIALIILMGYLLFPIDIVPDVIPVIGQMDDIIVIAIVVRYVFGGVGRTIVTEQWPGPQKPLQYLLRLARID